MLFAFLAPLVAAVPTAEQEQKPALPTFKPRWWYGSSRLDARPVIWSLRNKPEEWEPADMAPVWFIRHKPSSHVFKMRFEAGLRSANGCGCEQSTRCFQAFQSWQFKRAARKWLRNYERPAMPPVDHEHFASHFVRE